MENDGAQEMHGMRIIAYDVLSGHYRLILQPGEAGVMANFMGYLNT